MKIELCAPAGNLEKLRTAILYGADAVYVGVPGLSLRTKSSEMSIKQIQTGVSYAHEKHVKVYAALNIFPQNSDFPSIKKTIKQLDRIGVDAIIVSDPGVLSLIKRTVPRLAVHLSTQANVTNIEAARFWVKQGVQRIVMARELSLKEIAQISKNVPNLKTEVFAHGAMCMAYSGRCLLSSFLAGRAANKGECAQSCRWAYSLKESKRPDFLPIEEDAHGAYIMNSKDLCLIEYLPEIVRSGVCSVKIEGRMKSAYYVAVVTKAYRQAIDAFFADPQKYKCQKAWKDELAKVAHRGYTTGFYFGQPTALAHDYKSAKFIKTYDFVGVVDKCDPKRNNIRVAVRNQILAKDELEIVLPGQGKAMIVSPGQIKDEHHQPMSCAHNSYFVYLNVPKKVPVGSIVRRQSRE